MEDRPQRALEPDELLRVMDAAGVVRARREALEGHAAFDRDATVREIQVMYEELGELVDREVIEAALDDYLSGRRAFRPAPWTPATLLAWMYVRRGMLARRVLAPAAVLAGLVWAGLAVQGGLERQVLGRDARELRGAVEVLRDGHRQGLAELEALRSDEMVARLPVREAEALRAHLQAAEDRLAAVTGSVDPLAASRVPDDVTRTWVDENLGRLAGARIALDDARRALGEAAAIVRVQERLDVLAAEAQRLAASISDVAVEAGVAERGRALLATARRQSGARQVQELGRTVDELSAILTALEQEYEVVVTGGVWRHPNDDPDVRNHYLLVRAVDARGEAVPVRIENEETGRTERVSEWGERVAREVYEGVRADKEDNGLIDDEHFGTKSRGRLTLDRVHPDLGQITRW